MTKRKKRMKRNSRVGESMRKKRTTRVLLMMKKRQRKG
jgi:hypothetical protein